MSATVLMEVSDGIALLTLNRPQKLNALNYEMVDRLMALCDLIEGRPDIGAVILTGAGNRAFSAGADIDEFSQTVRQGADATVRTFVRRGQAMTARLENFSKPVIAAVDGLAYGGGCEITEAAHLAIASHESIFCKSEIWLGMPPTFGGTQRLPRHAGRKRALELLLTGRPFSAKQALDIGLVNEIAARADVLPAARTLARRIMGHRPEAAAAILAAVTRGLNVSMDEGLRVEADQFSNLASTPGFADSLANWREHRRQAE